MAENSGLCRIIGQTDRECQSRPLALKCRGCGDTPAPASVTKLEADGDGVPYNKVLSFELQLTQPAELLEWLTSRGISADAVNLFGLGLASNKSKTIGGRLAIPLHKDRKSVV